MQPLKRGDAAAFLRLFDFLFKCQTMGNDSKHNLLDTPEMIYISKIDGIEILCYYEEGIQENEH